MAVSAANWTRATFSFVGLGLLLMTSAFAFSGRAMVAALVSAWTAFLAATVTGVMARRTGNRDAFILTIVGSCSGVVLALFLAALYVMAELAQK